LGRFARSVGIPTVYYFPPGSWRRKPRDPSALLGAADKIITPFPWSRDLLAEAGADVAFLGHPMLDRVKPSQSKSKMLRELKIEPGTRVIGLLPGSRMHEIRNNLPAMLGASKIISEASPGLCAYLIPTISERAMADVFKMVLPWIPGKFKGNPDSEDDPTLAQYRVMVDATYDVMAHADFLISCSGTATLEAMILGTPMIIIYRGSRLMKVEYLLRKGMLESYIGMPNIVAGREICPELLGDQASPEKIAETALDYLGDPEKSKRMREELSKETAVLGKPGATRKAAEEILQFARLRSSQ
jgi:lipid-A-disaccharide synthase